MVKQTHMTGGRHDEDRTDKHLRGRPGEGWLTVAPSEDPDAIELQLALNDDPAAKAYQQALFERGERAIMFYVDDVQAEYDRLTAAGAEFTMPPTKVTGSSIAVLNDTVGNLIQLTKLDRWQ
jgi:hypothetical protein